MRANLRETLLMNTEDDSICQGNSDSARTYASAEIGIGKGKHIGYFLWILCNIMPLGLRSTALQPSTSHGVGSLIASVALCRR